MLLDGKKGSSAPPLNRIDMKDEETQLIIKEMSGSGNS